MADIDGADIGSGTGSELHTRLDFGCHVIDSLLVSLRLAATLGGTQNAPQNTQIHMLVGVVAPAASLSNAFSECRTLGLLVPGVQT